MEFELMSQEELQRSVQELLDRQAKPPAAAPPLAPAAADVLADPETLAKKADQLTDGLIALTTLVKRVVDDIDRVVEQQTAHPGRRNRDADVRVDQLNRFVAKAEAQLTEVIGLFERTLAIQNVTRRDGE